MERKRENPVSLAGEHGAELGVQLGETDNPNSKPTRTEPQASLGLDDWRQRVIRDADEFMRRKARETGKPRRHGRRGRHG